MGVAGSRAGPERGRVKAAFEALGAAGGREAEARGRIVGRALGAGVDLGLGGGRVLGVGEGARAAGGVVGRVGGGGAKVGGLIAGDRGGDPGSVEGGGRAACERRAACNRGRVDADGGAGLGRALDSGLLSLAGESGSVSVRLGACGSTRVLGREASGCRALEPLLSGVGRAWRGRLYVWPSATGVVIPAPCEGEPPCRSRAASRCSPRSSRCEPSSRPRAEPLTLGACCRWPVSRGRCRSGSVWRGRRCRP